jgi:hypothetical protein
LGWVGRHGMKGWVGGGSWWRDWSLDLSGGGREETDGRQCGRHARITQRELPNPHVRLDRRGNDNPFRINDKSPTILAAARSRGGSASFAGAPLATAAPAGIVVKSCPSKTSKRRPAAALPPLGRRQAAKQAAAAAMRPRRFLLLLLPLHGTLASSCRAPPRLAWVG